MCYEDEKRVYRWPDPGNSEALEHCKLLEECDKCCRSAHFVNGYTLRFGSFMVSLACCYATNILPFVNVDFQCSTP